MKDINESIGDIGRAGSSNVYSTLGSQLCQLGYLCSCRHGLTTIQNALEDRLGIRSHYLFLLPSFFSNLNKTN